MGKITAQHVANMRPGTTMQRVQIDTGLQLRIATSGVKTWVVRYTVNGNVRDYRFPRVYGVVSDAAHMSLADARGEAKRILALAREGIDFQVQADEERAAGEKLAAAQRAAQDEKDQAEQRDRLSVRDLYDSWIRDGVRRQNENADLKRQFNADVLPRIGGRQVRLLNEHDVRALLRTIVDRGVDRTAVMVKDNLTQMFAWAEKRQPWRKLLIDGNPMDLIEIEKIVSPGFDLNNQRKRILSAEEIRELRAITLRMQTNYDNSPDKRYGQQPLEEITQLGIWIMLSTLCRVGEMSMARWENVSLKSAKWFIPKEDVKDKIGSLDVFLSPFALEQFERLHDLTGHTCWCFPGRGNESHLDVKSITKQIGDRQAQFKKDRAGGPRQPMKNRRFDNSLVLGGGKNGAWTPHDLRRTGATMMQALGVPLDTIDRCQNHVLDGSKIRRHYLHHDYAKEKRDAWNLLGAEISKIFYPDDVSRDS
jgi:integrase